MDMLRFDTHFTYSINLHYRYRFLWYIGISFNSHLLLLPHEDSVLRADAPCAMHSLPILSICTFLSYFVLDGDTTYHISVTYNRKTSRAGMEIQMPINYLCIKYKLRVMHTQVHQCTSCIFHTSHGTMICKRGTCIWLAG